VTPNQLRSARDLLCMTQTELAHAVGCRSYKTVARWEHGLIPVSQSAVIIISDLLRRCREEELP
jgi:transcriptional regulator with XRE-family HTH domain